MSKKNRNQTSNSTEKATQESTQKAPEKETTVSLEEANSKAKNKLVRGSSVTDIVAVLKANKGQVMTGQEIATAIGDSVSAASVRHKMQKQGLSSRANGVIAIGKDWIHLAKLDGGLNGYKLTDAGIE